MSNRQDAVTRYMRLVSDNHTKHGDLNMTALAEDAAYEFDLYENDDGDIPEWVFEIAATLADE